MANARIGNYIFDIDPSSASWTYKMNTNSQDTYGGRVIQILSCRIETLKISGYLTSKGTAENQWAQMEAFENAIRSIMEYHASTKKPVVFTFDALEWAGQVFLKGYSDISYDMETAAIQYTLMMEVDTGFDTIQRSASTEGLEVIPNGVNWTRNVYNTPKGSSWETVKSALKEILEKAGTYDATNPPDIYQKLEEAMKEESEIVATQNASESRAVSTKGGYAGLIEGQDY